MPRESKKQWPLTVAPELHNAWKNARRKGDPEELAKVCGVSRPVIDRALIYGYVSVEGLTDKINKYFEDRLRKERKDAARIESLQVQQP
jgi:nitrogen regulatory protein PII-like uncharacterized protein